MPQVWSGTLDTASLATGWTDQPRCKRVEKLRAVLKILTLKVPHELLHVAISTEHVRSFPRLPARVVLSRVIDVQSVPYFLFDGASAVM